MKGIDTLIAIRQAGKKPQSVWIEFGNYRKPRYLDELRHLALGYAPTSDYRPFVGLDVFLSADKWLPDIGQVFDKLTQYAKSITVLVVEFGDDIGFYWTREAGKHNFGEQQNG